LTGDGSFLVEDFINAVAAQLDRVQDALRLKAVNRPLTYALRDFSLDLQVFVSMDPEGNVTFRSSAPNEAGASTIRLGFTTITKPMIEENTISLAMSRSPGLDELGLSPEETKRLGQYGVHNAAQLKRLGSLTGNSAVSRLSGIPIDRLRAALQLGVPQVSHVQPHVQPGPGQPGPHVSPPSASGPPHTAPVQPVQPGIQPHFGGFQPSAGLPSLGGVMHPSSPLPNQAVVNGPALHGVQPVAFTPKPPVAHPVIRIAPDVAHIRLSGRNLMSEEGPPDVRLNGMSLSLAHADDDHLIVALPERDRSGMLEVQMPDGQTQTYRLELAPHAEVELSTPGVGGAYGAQDAYGAYGSHDADPWAPPTGGGR
jgi:hypothetical protein